MYENVCVLKADEFDLEGLKIEDPRGVADYYRNVDVEQLMKNVNAEKSLRIIRDVLYLLFPSCKYRYGDWILYLFENYFADNVNDFIEISNNIIADDDYKEIDWYEFKKSPYFKNALEVCEKVYNKIFSQYKPTDEIAIKIIYYNTDYRGLEYINRAKKYGI